MTRTLLIDNYDSFTFNVCHLLSVVNGTAPLVIRNDQLTWAQVCRLDIDNIVISPGPGWPDRAVDFGVCRDVIEYATTIPVLGICLGHQGIGCQLGARVKHAPEPMHGRISEVRHEGTDLFEGLPSPLRVVRYHSLVVADDVPKGLIVQARTMDGIIMAMRARDRPLWGIQFHPESICAESGEQLMRNFRRLTLEKGTRRYYAPPLPPQVADPAQEDTRPIKVHKWHTRTRRLGRLVDPQSTFARCFATSESAFWLDSSAVIPGVARFSFMGDTAGVRSKLVTYRCAERVVTVRTGADTTDYHESILEYLRRELSQCHIDSSGLPFDFTGGFVGFFGYEMKAECGGSLGHCAETPDAAFIFSDRFVAFDHQEGSTWLVHIGTAADSAEADAWFAQLEHGLAQNDASLLSPSTKEAASIDFRLRFEKEEYLRLIRSAQQEICDGESYEVCLTNSLSAVTDADPFEIYCSLRTVNPAPYSVYLTLPGVNVLCSSPERFLKIDSKGVIESKPIKGTIRRGRTEDEDQQLSEELAHSEKDRAENLMIVDLLRNDLGRVCEIGSVKVPKLMGIESFATVHQMVSTIRGTLREGCGAVEAIRAAFPGGSMTGAPKVRTMEIIDRLEGSARGIYSGAIGFLALNGTMDLNIAIRTIVMNKGIASIGAGGAVTSLSDAEAEFEEMLLKARAPMLAVRMGVASKIANP